MFLIMVGNIASIFTQVYIAKMTPIYNFFPHLLYTVPFASLSLLWAHVDIFMVVFICNFHRPSVQWGFCLHFSWWNFSNKSHCSQKSRWQYLFLVCHVEVLQYKCRNSLCWYSQNTRGCTSMLWLRSFQHHISCTLDDDNLPHQCISCWVECFVADLLGSHYNPISCLCEHYLGLNLYWQVLQFYYLANSGHQVSAAILDLICNHSTRFTNTIWKIFLILLYCPIAVCFTSQHVLQ